MTYTIKLDSHIGINNPSNSKQQKIKDIITFFDWKIQEKIQLTRKSDNTIYQGIKTIN